MAHFKNHMYQHLRSAKEWLIKAETAFDEQRDIRAELDLMLAQAELKHVKEISRSKQWRYKYLLMRHGLALTCAMLVAVGLGGAYWWTNKPEVAVTVPHVEQVKLPVEAKQEVELNVIPLATDPKVQVISTVVPKENKLPTQQAVNQVVTSQSTKTEQPQQEEDTVVLSPDEMQKLVRAAGKTLRGQ